MCTKIEILFYFSLKMAFLQLRMWLKQPAQVGIQWTAQYSAILLSVGEWLISQPFYQWLLDILILTNAKCDTIITIFALASIHHHSVHYVLWELCETEILDFKYQWMSSRNSPEKILFHPFPPLLEFIFHLFYSLGSLQPMKDPRSRLNSALIYIIHLISVGRKVIQ